MHSDIKKDEISSQGQEVSATREKEKLSGQESKGPQSNANEKFNRLHREPKANEEDRYSKKLPNAIFRPLRTGGNISKRKADGLQTNSRCISRV